jgi:hypothetical protein
MERQLNKSTLLLNIWAVKYRTGNDDMKKLNRGPLPLWQYKLILCKTAAFYMAMHTPSLYYRCEIWALKSRPDRKNKSR